MRASHPSSKTKAPTPAGAFCFKFGFGLPHGEVNLVQVDRVGVHGAIAVLLVVDGDAVPSGGARRTVDIERVRDAVQSDGLEQQVPARSTRHLDYEMVPGIVLRIAGNSGRDPLFMNVVISVPLMAARDPALMPPDVAFPTCGPEELIDIELKRLRVPDVRGIKIDIVDEVASALRQSVAVIGQTLCGKRSHEVIVPKQVGICPSASDVLPGSAATHRRRRNISVAIPIESAGGRRARTTNRPTRRK